MARLQRLAPVAALVLAGVAVVVTVVLMSGGGGREEAPAQAGAPGEASAIAPDDSGRPAPLDRQDLAAKRDRKRRSAGSNDAALVSAPAVGGGARTPVSPVGETPTSAVRAATPVAAESAERDRYEEARRAVDRDGDETGGDSGPGRPPGGADPVDPGAGTPGDGGTGGPGTDPGVPDGTRPGGGPPGPPAP